MGSSLSPIKVPGSNVMIISRCYHVTLIWTKSQMPVTGDISWSQPPNTIKMICTWAHVDAGVSCTSCMCSRSNVSLSCLLARLNNYTKKGTKKIPTRFPWGLQTFQTHSAGSIGPNLTWIGHLDQKLRPGKRHVPKWFIDFCPFSKYFLIRVSVWSI